MPERQSTEQEAAATAAATITGPSSERPPFRADHVGSLLRPPEVLRAREDFAAGRIGADELRGTEDAAIREVVRQQHEVGLRSATDGEFRRESWHMDFIYQLGGVQKVQDDTIRVAFHNEQRTYEWAPPSAHVVAPLTLEHTIFGEAFTFLADAVAGTGMVAKLTIPSLSMVHYRGGRSAIDETVYPDLDQFWADLAAAYAEEVRRLYDLGCRYLQFDDTSLAYMNDPAQRRHVAEIGGDPEHQHEHYIANINRALAGRPAGLAVTTHMCRGNNQSMWAAEGGYEFVAELRVGRRALGQLRAAAVRAQGQAGRAGAGDQQARRAGEQGRPEAADRAGVAVRRHRPTLPVAAVRVLLDQGRQRSHAGAAVGEARPDRRDRAAGVGLGVRPAPEPGICRFWRFQDPVSTGGPPRVA